MPKISSATLSHHETSLCHHRGNSKTSTAQASTTTAPRTGLGEFAAEVAIERVDDDVIDAIQGVLTFSGWKMWSSMPFKVSGLISG